MRLYNTRRWINARLAFLREHPLCRFCEQNSRTEPATVVDHIQPHRGDEELFWDVDNWQPLCKPCHDRAKQLLEKRGYHQHVGSDGWPTDPRHPANC